MRNIEQEFQFTEDWFSQHEPGWKTLFGDYLPQGCDKILEIGSFEGRSTCWLLQNALRPNGSMYCIDTWQGSREITNEQMHGVLQRFKHNVKLARGSDQKLFITQNDSTIALASLIGNHMLVPISNGFPPVGSFDFIYVDAGHLASEALTDAVMAWPLLRPGGMMIFDDYAWRLQDEVTTRPKMAVDAFTTIFHDSLTTVCCGYQYAVVKKQSTRRWIRKEALNETT